MDTDLPKNISNTAEEAPLAEKGMGVGKKKREKNKTRKKHYTRRGFCVKN